MANKCRSYSISEFCKKRGYKIHHFYSELKKYPDREGKLHTNSKGEYVIDVDTLEFIGDILRVKKERNRKRHISDRKSNPSSAVAAEINLLTAENERLKKEVKRLNGENKRLRGVIEHREKARSKYRETAKTDK